MPGIPAQKMPKKKQKNSELEAILNFTERLFVKKQNNKHTHISKQ